MNEHREPTASTRTRTLHALELPARICDPGAAPLRRALYVDCETTGLSFERDQVIEVAMLPFTYTADGRIAEVLHHEAQVYLQDPGRPLDAQITALTGLTDDDVRGQHIDVEAATALIARSNLVVAHNSQWHRSKSGDLSLHMRAARSRDTRCSGSGCPTR